MKIVVYFETPKVLYAEVVAQFSSEELYHACLPILEDIAQVLFYRAVLNVY